MQGGQPPKPPLRSGAYLAWVRTHACVGCLRPGPSDAHHVGREGMGQKVHDFRCVPLCRICHGAAEARTDQQLSPKRLQLEAARLLLRYLGLDVVVRMGSQ